MCEAEKPRTILFRCDGTSHTGLGHLSRSIALAEALDDVGCQCAFVGTYDASAAERLRAAGMHWDTPQTSPWSIEDADALTRIAVRRHALGVVVDSYGLDAEYLDRVATKGPPLLVIDDFAVLSRYPCAAVLNFTSRSGSLLYPGGRVQYFLGPRWLLARRALRRRRADGVRELHRARRALIAAGGNDPQDITVPTTEALLACAPRLSVRVVIGANQGTRPALERLLARFDGDTRILGDLPDLSRELYWADLCISSGGLTKYEAAYFGIPTGVLSQNDGQLMDTASMEEMGLVVNLGPASQIDATRLGHQLRRLADDGALRESLRQTGLIVLPPDPTHDFATLLLSQVFRRT